MQLDEPIAAHVRDPDLQDDARYQTLTPRLLLSHRAGLLNWPDSYPDGKLAFVHDPGTRFSYSGAGIEMAARYAEARTGRDFEQLAIDHVLTPLGATEMSMGRLRPWMHERLAQPMDAEGRFRPLSDLNPGIQADAPWNGADDLLTTVDAYGRLLSGLLRKGTLPDAHAAQRATVLTSLANDTMWTCTPEPGLQCPRSYGHGLGWMVYDYGSHTVLKHGGNDAGENALVYFSPDTGDGAIIFVNGGNGIFVTVRIMELLGQEPDLTAYYRQLIERHYGVRLSPLAHPTPSSGSATATRPRLRSRH